MKLELGKFHVEGVEFGSRTGWQKGILTINERELHDVIVSDVALSDVDLAIAQPGESARIIHVLDAVPLIAKVDGPGQEFSGFFGMPETVGEGRTHIIDGAAVLTCAELPWGAGGLLIPREGVIDMSGPGSYYSPFAGLYNIVLGLKLAEGLSDQEYDTAVRLAGLKAARYLAKCVKELEPDEVEEFELGPVDPDLPRFGYIHQIQSQGLFARSFVYGKNVDAILPTLIHPNEMMDGAVVSSNYVYACYKTPTYIHCYDPVMLKLYRGHGVTHNFVGVIISRGHHYTYAEKVRSATYAANVARMAGCDGVVITWEGGGNSIIEAMTTVQKCEQMGVKTAIVAYEFGNDPGTQSLLLDSVPEADLVISAGSTERSISLPKMDRVLGGSEDLRLDPALGGVQMPAAGPLEFDRSHVMFCSANHTGFGYLAAREY